MAGGGWVVRFVLLVRFWAYRPDWLALRGRLLVRCLGLVPLAASSSCLPRSLSVFVHPKAAGARVLAGLSGALAVVLVLCVDPHGMRADLDPEPITVRFRPACRLRTWIPVRNGCLTARSGRNGSVGIPVTRTIRPVADKSPGGTQGGRGTWHPRARTAPTSPVERDKGEEPDTAPGLWALASLGGRTSTTARGERGEEGDARLPPQPVAAVPAAGRPKRTRAEAPDEIARHRAVASLGGRTSTNE